MVFCLLFCLLCLSDKMTDSALWLVRRPVNQTLGQGWIWCLQWEVFPDLANFCRKIKHTSMHTHRRTHKAATGNQYIHCYIMMGLMVFELWCGDSTLIFLTLCLQLNVSLEICSYKNAVDCSIVQSVCYNRLYGEHLYVLLLCICLMLLNLYLLSIRLYHWWIEMHWWRRSCVWPQVLFTWSSAWSSPWGNNLFFSRHPATFCLVTCVGLILSIFLWVHCCCC